MNKTLLSLLLPLSLLGYELNAPLLDWAKRHNLFQKNYFQANEENFVRLVREGQSPQTLFIGCSDSRVIPELITQSNPGEIFVIRTAGNFVPTKDLSPVDGVEATIQFGVEAVKVKEIIVCGHSSCAAIDGVIDMNRVATLKALSRWVKLGEEAGNIYRSLKEKGDQIKDPNGFVGRLSVLVQIEHLLTYPEIKEKVERGELKLHGWYFDIAQGKLEVWNDEQGDFIPLSGTIKN